MKFKFLNCIFLICFIFSGVLYSDEKRQVEEKEVEIIDGKAYVKGENKPFSGNIIVRYDSGEISSIYALKEGLRQGITNYYYYKNGKLKAELTYVNDKLNGNMKEFYENGNIQSETEYKDDVLYRKRIERYENGNLKTTSEWNRFLDGEKIEYHKNGKIKKKEIYKNGELQKDGLSKFWNILVILAFGIPFLLLPFSFFKIYKQFPKVKLLDEYQKEKMLEILVKYNLQIPSLHSSYSINGTGTTYVKIRNFKIREEKFSISAKMYSVFWMPMPYIIGYIVCHDKDKIISSFSKESFQKIKDEMQEKIL